MVRLQGLVTTALQPSGLLGYLQGARLPAQRGLPMEPERHRPAGVGTFLLAGAQMAAMEAAEKFKDPGRRSALARVRHSEISGGQSESFVPTRRHRRGGRDR